MNVSSRNDGNGTHRTDSACNVFQLFQRPQRGFHKAVLFLIAFETGDQVTSFGEGFAEGVTKVFGLLDQAGGGLGIRRIFRGWG